MRYRVATVLTAAAVAYWITVDSTSFLWTFLISFAVLAIGAGIAALIGDVSRDVPLTYSEDELEWIEYIEALERTIR